ncbi:MAG: outer membrane beta-barrel protein [Opitutales bacterium]|jgi:hypothetical protein
MKTNTKLAVAFLAAASSIAAQAADAPAPAVTFGGYAVVTGSVTKDSGAASVSDLDLTAAKFGVTAKLATNVTAYASLYYNGSDADLLDAYVTFDAGSGLTITAGNFLSYMGYEAFDAINMAQISYANGGLLGGPVPAYHTGVKFDYATGNHGIGAAVVDSIYGSTLFNGDGDYSKKGLEAYYTYKGIKDTQIWLGGLQDNDNGGAVYDLWVSYALSKTESLGAEYLVKESDGYNWLLAYTKGIDSKLSVTARLSGESSDVADAKFVKYTLSPAYAFTDKFTVRAEISYTDYSGAGAATSNSTFYAIQSLFKF